MVELSATIRKPPTPLQYLPGVFAIVMALIAPSYSVPAKAKENSPSLHLSNGSFLPGRILDSDLSDQITWHSSLFTRPFVFPLAGISAIQYPVIMPAPKPSGEYCFELSSGDVLYGNLLELADATLKVQTGIAGTVTIRNRDVQRIYRWQETSLIYLGPNGLEGWKDGDVEARFSKRWSDDGGWPTTSSVDARLFQDFKLPPRASIEFEISWKKHPDFQFMFGVNELQSGDLHVFRLEVWDDNIVLMGETERDADVAVVTPIVSGAGAARGLLYLDQEKQRISLYSRTGRHKATVKIHSKNPVSRQGLRLVNRSGDVRLNHLRIAHWDGILARDVQTDKSRIHSTDGTIAYGKVSGFDPKSGVFTVRNGERTTELNADTISDIFLSPAIDNAEPADDNRGNGEAQTDGSSSLRVVYQDGSRYSGQLNGIKKQTLQLTSSSILEPLKLPMQGLRSIGAAVDSKPTVAESTELPGRSGRLELDGVRLQGRLVDGSESPEASCLVWHPDFSSNSSPMMKNLAGRIVYRDPPKPKVVKATSAQNRQIVIRQMNRQPVAQGFGDVFKQMLTGKVTPARKAKVKSPQTLHLRSGDTIPCEVISVDEEGLHFTTPLSSATFVANARIKGVELNGKSGSPDLDELKRNRLLTLPRLQKNSPPTHLIYSTNGDFLRGRLISMTEQVVTIEVRLTNREIPRERISQVIWLHADELEPDRPGSTEALATSTAAGGSNAASADPASDSNTTDNKDSNQNLQLAKTTRVQTLVRNKDRLTFFASSLKGSTLSGNSDILGECHSELADVDQLLFGDYIEQAASQLAYHRWRLHHATEPKFVLAEDGDPSGPPITGTESPLVGKQAPDFKLSDLAGSDFHLAEHRGKIIVLDFWATWCGPCLKTMPLIDEVVHEFPENNVQLLAINMEEQPAEIKSTLERHKLNVPVVLDIDGVAAARYSVTSIPQTVVIDQQGNIARLFVGGGPKLVEPLRKAIAELTGEPSAPARQAKDDNAK